MTKNCQICSFCQIFVTFMKLFLSEFKYILNFDTFLPHFLAIFVSFLTHFGFWHIFVRFTEIFDSNLSQFCVLTHFWQIFVNFCYIFDTFLKWWDLHWQPVPKSALLGSKNWPKYTFFWTFLLSLFRSCPCTNTGTDKPTQTTHALVI